MSATTPRARPANDERDMPKLGGIAQRVVKRSKVEALRVERESAIPSGMTPAEFQKIRKDLGLTQTALAKVLGYSGSISISNFERDKNPREIPFQVALLMQAFKDGWRSPDWPNGGE